MSNKDRKTQGKNGRVIYLIRHGITEGNQKRWYYGAADVPLAKEGVASLKGLVSQGIYPDCTGTNLFTSGLIRTEQTLSLIFGERDHGVLEAFREFDFGDFERKTHEDLKGNQIYLDWIRDETGEKPAPNGESRREFCHRVWKGFEELLAGWGEGKEEKDTILVCHGGVIGVIMDCCFVKEREHMFKWIPDPGHGYSIIVEEGKPVTYEAF